MSNDASLDINPKSNPVQTVAPTKEDNNMTRATDKITALYCRLSVEDTKEKGGKDDPSNSIQHQQIMLMEYAKSRHFPNPTYFIDDGYSGVEFNNRPGFQRMLAEIEAGHVEVVITKDLSRLGRNSSLTGLYINYTFPQYGVRYIAINDHFDTIDPNSTDNDVAGIKNWFNEFFAKDTSRKIRAVQKAKGERGVPLTTNVPFGYRKDPEDRTKWIVDEAAALVVKRIFKLCMEGRGPMQIAKLLQAEKVLNPTSYKRREGIKSPSPETADPYHWNTNTVVHILERREYTGCTVNFKTYSKSHKLKKRLQNAPENYRIFPNTQPAIIEEKMFERVQELRANKRRPTKTGRQGLFSGLLYCADCGEKLYFCTTNSFTPKQEHYVCSNYKSNTGTCSAHFIREETLKLFVRQRIFDVTAMFIDDIQGFQKIVYQQRFAEAEKAVKRQKKELEQARKRIAELDRIFKRIYEDDINGTISHERFLKLSSEYEAEQKELTAFVKTEQAAVDTYEQDRADFDSFAAIIRKYVGIRELTPTIVNEFVKKIIVHAPDKSTGHRRQRIEIVWNFIGELEQDEDKQTIERQRKSRTA